jgi:cell division protein FtsB
MPSERSQAEKNKAEDESVLSLPMRAQAFARRVWPPAASVLAVGLTLWLGWQVVYEKNGLSAWQQKRAEERQLLKENDDLKQENSRLRDQIDRLKSDPDAIGIVARSTRRYIKPNEVIVTLPPEQKAQAQPAGTVK